MGQWRAAAGSSALSVAVPAWDLWKEVTIIFITSTIVWPQVNKREGKQPHPSTENLIKDLLSIAPHIRTRPSFPLSQSLLSGSFHKPLREHKQNLVLTRTQEKGAVTPQETDPDLPVSVQETPAEVWVGGGLLQGWGH